MITIKQNFPMSNGAKLNFEGLPIDFPTMGRCIVIVSINKFRRKGLEAFYENKRIRRKKQHYIKNAAAL